MWFLGFERKVVAFLVENSLCGRFAVDQVWQLQVKRSAQAQVLPWSVTYMLLNIPFHPEIVVDSNTWLGLGVDE